MARLGTVLGTTLGTVLGTDLAPGSTGPTWYFLDTLDDTNNYATTASPGGIVGSAAGFWYSFIIMVMSQGVASLSRTVCSNFTSATSGYWAFTGTTNATVNAGCYANPAASLIMAPAYTIAAGDVGKPLICLFWHDGAGKIHLAAKGVEIGTGTAITSYTPATLNTRIGRRNSAGVSANDEVRIAGLVGGVGVPSAGEISAHYAACALAADVVSIAGKTDHLWSAKQDGPSLPASLLDKVGTDNAPKVGTPTIVTYVGQAA